MEQLYRDQRLNPIHEGTEGIHGLDLLGRKVLLNNGESYQMFLAKVGKTVADAENLPQIAHLAPPVRAAIERTNRVTESLLPRVVEDPDSGLANATIYLDMFGQVVMAWIWLRQAVVAARTLSTSDVCPNEPEYDFYQGKVSAAQYFIRRELPQTVQKAALLEINESTCFDMPAAYF